TLFPAGRGSAGEVSVALGSISPAVTLSKLPLWRRRPIAAAIATLSVVSIAAVATLGLTTGMPVPWGAAPTPTAPAQPWLASRIRLPFTVDAPRGARDPDFAGLLTHELTAPLARFGELRLISDRTADLYRDVDLARLGAELDVRYAVVGRVQHGDG